MGCLFLVAHGSDPAHTLVSEATSSGLSTRAKRQRENKRCHQGQSGCPIQSPYSFSSLAGSTPTCGFTVLRTLLSKTAVSVHFSK